MNAEFALAVAKLVITLVCILALLRLKVRLWLAICAGCLVVAGMALAGGVPFMELALAPLRPLGDSTFILMEAMIFGILLLSGLLGATGQSRRLVGALDRYLRWPRLRLIVFPALVGLLPMPGGALFSCPMLDAASHGLDIPPQRKTLINYWFRHIWETTWPLYPGFVLVCSLVGVAPYTLMACTFPLVFISGFIGWIFFIRDIEVTDSAKEAHPAQDDRPLYTLLYEALPILIAIVGAGILGAVLSAAVPQAPSQVAFVIALVLANFAAVRQGRKHYSGPLAGLVLNRRTLSMLLLIYVIFVFKDTIAASGIISEMRHAGGSLAVVLAITVILPMICGMLTGVMVGYVGASFPIFLGILNEGGLGEYILPFTVLGIACGQIGQLSTPLHVCIVVTCEYYKVQYGEIIGKMIAPLCLLFAGAALLVGFLFATGAHF